MGDESNTVAGLSTDKHYRVNHMPGIAFYFRGMQTETRTEWYCEDGEEDGYWDEEEVETGMAEMVMVGDDHIHIVDPDDIEELPEDEFCRDCGQIGCGHNVYQ